MAIKYEYSTNYSGTATVSFRIPRGKQRATVYIAFSAAVTNIAVRVRPPQQPTPILPKMAFGTDVAGPATSYVDTDFVLGETIEISWTNPGTTVTMNTYIAFYP